MGCLSKGLALVLILTMASSSLIIVKPVFAQFATPSIPIFTVQYIVNTAPPVAPTYTINPYTGQNETLSVGSNGGVVSKSIEVVINNEPFSQYSIQNNGITWEVNVYFDIRYKGHFSINWTDPGPDGYLFENPSSQITTKVLYTTNLSPYSDTMNLPPVGGQIDVQVQAFIGYIYYGATYAGGQLTGNQAYFNGTGSGWSNTQTMTVPASSISTNSTNVTPISTPMPAVPEITPLALLPLLLSVFSVAVIFRHRKKTAHPNPCELQRLVFAAFLINDAAP